MYINVRTRHFAEHDVSSKSEKTDEKIISSSVRHSNCHVIVFFYFVEDRVEPEHDRFGSFEPVSLHIWKSQREELIEFLRKLENVASVRSVGRFFFDRSKLGFDEILLLFGQKTHF